MSDASAASAPASRAAWVVAAVVAIVVVDQLTKSWAVVGARRRADATSIGDHVKFELTRNSGSAFSGFQGYTPVLAVIAIVITILIARAVRRATDPLDASSGSCSCSAVRSATSSTAFARSPGFLRGHVVDFVAVGWWPVFNVADSCVTIGAILLVVRTLFAPTRRAGLTVDTDVDEPIAVPAALDGERVDRAVALLTGWPRAAVQALLESGDGARRRRTVSKSHQLREGSVVEVLGRAAARRAARRRRPRSRSTCATPTTTWSSSRSRPGSSCIPARPRRRHARQRLLARYPEIATVGDPMRPGIVHRLDRDTSGLLVVGAVAARVRRARRAARGARRSSAGTSRSCGARSASPRGVVDAPIGRSQARRTRMAVRDAGKPARTEYEVQRACTTTPVCSLLECRLETGRTHQIRVHLAAIGHPVVGDATYGGHRTSRSRSTVRSCTRRRSRSTTR